MKVLVTGGAGYIGSHVVSQLRLNGFVPVVIDDLSNGFRDAVPSETPFFQGDIGDEQLLDVIFKEHSPAAVLHFAGKISVSESVQDPYTYYQTNVCKSLQLFQACIRHQVHKVIFSSTAAVYEANSLLLDETSALAPASPYGRSKLACEWVLRDLAATGQIDFMILRYFNVAGADPALERGQAAQNASHLIKIAAEVALGKRPKLTVFGDDYGTHDGTCVRDYIHVVDLAKAHVLVLRALLEDGQKNEIFNCGYGQGVSVKEVTHCFQKANGVDLPLQMGLRRPGDTASLVANPQKLKSILGWSPQHASLEEICKTAFHWEQRLNEFREQGLWL